MTSLLRAFQPLTVDAIAAALSTLRVGRHLVVHDEVTSTNSVAAALLQNDPPDGTVVVAERQTAGRGRLGREWVSPMRKSLLFTVLLRALPPDDRLTWAPLVAAVSVARAIETTGGGTPILKWPNDLLLGAKKLGGILSERIGIGRDGGALLIGIGLNVNVTPADFPEDLRTIATSLQIERGRPFDRAVLLAAILSELELRWDALTSDAAGAFMDEYRVRCGTLGQHVRIDRGASGTVEGRAIGVNRDGSLRVQPDSAPPIDIMAGDVVHLR